MARLILIATLLAWLGAPEAQARLPDARERPQDISKIATDPFTIALAASVAGARSLRTVGLRRQIARLGEPMDTSLAPFWAQPFDAGRIADGVIETEAFAVGAFAAGAFGGALDGLPLIQTFPDPDLPSPRAAAARPSSAGPALAMALALALTALAAAQFAVRRAALARRPVR